MTPAVATREVDLVLPPTPDAATAARGAVTANGLDPELEHPVALLVTELVTNSVRHSGVAEPIHFHARVGLGRVQAEVEDHGPGFDPAIRHTASGFGLRLVDRLATRWGVESGPPTRVWFEVDRLARDWS
jgi:anti-sigma regulatory factor (Ser/Thr protein kinase)